MLNLTTASTRAELMSRLDRLHIFDTSVDYFVNMPSWTQSGDMGFQKIYQCAFVGASLKIRGATGSPIRPLALPPRS